MHLHAAHGHDLSMPDDTEQPLLPDIVQEYHEKLTGLLSPLILIIVKSYHTGNVCDENGMDLPEGMLPLPHTPWQDQDDWTPYWNQLDFETTCHGSTGSPLALLRRVLRGGMTVLEGQGF